MKKLFALGVALLFAASVSAVWYPHEGSGITVDIPKSWKVDGTKNSLQAVSQQGKGNAVVVMRVLKDEKTDAALAHLDEQLGTMLQNIQHGASEQLELNGLQAHWTEGTGEFNGTAVEFDVVVVATPSAPSPPAWPVTALTAAAIRARVIRHCVANSSTTPSPS